MVKHNTPLMSAEIAGLWSTYIYNTMSSCFSKHLLNSTTDEDIRPLLEEVLKKTEKEIADIKAIFEKEKFPIPDGFSESDLDLSAPPLYSELFGLSYVYGMSQLAVLALGKFAINVAREDVLIFFTEALESSMKLYNKSIKLMLEKGVYDRAPKFPYPKRVEYVEKSTIIEEWFGDKRPLNAIEASEVFMNLERNAFATTLLLGFLQAVKDEEIKDYLKKGMHLAEKQLSVFNDILKDDIFMGEIPVPMEVLDSEILPFSDKFVLFLISSLNSNGITFLAHSISVSMRKDLITKYSRLMLEIMLYGEEGLELLIKRGWMEKVPQAPDRKKMIDG